MHFVSFTALLAMAATQVLGACPNPTCVGAFWTGLTPSGGSGCAVRQYYSTTTKSPDLGIWVHQEYHSFPIGYLADLCHLSGIIASTVNPSCGWTANNAPQLAGVSATMAFSVFRRGSMYIQSIQISHAASLRCMLDHIQSIHFKLVQKCVEPVALAQSSSPRLKTE